MNHDEKWLEEHDEYLDDHEVYAKAYAEHMQQERTTGDYVHLLELALSGQTRSNTLLEEANVSYAGIQDELFVAHERIAALEDEREQSGKLFEPKEETDK